MAQKTDLNVSPYYDDFAEDKNFHRVLFKPSAAIQARELTQLQSILQNQIERFGSHMFKEGAIILGARTNYDNQYFGVRVEDTNPNGSGVQATESFRTESVGKFYQGQTTGVVGKVVNTSQKTTDDPLTLHVKYQATGNVGSTFYTEFQDGEILDEVTQDSNNLGGYSSASSNNQFKVFSISGSTDIGSMVGSSASISEGIIYTRGMFVKVPAQTIILEKYSNTPSYKIGVDIAETLTTYTEDSSLLDNAAGSSNENAPGADRLTLTLTLAKKSLTATDSTDFIELMRLSAGEVVKKQEITEYNRLQETLARRTFDESGDYTLQPFTLGFREHLNDLSNNGVYTSTDSPRGDSEKFIATLSAGKAYVRGFEVDKQTPTFLTFNKARTTLSKNNVASPFRIGNFLRVNNTFGLPDIDEENPINSYSTINLYDTALGSSGNGTGGGQQIGFARVRAYEGNADSTDDEVYLFDITMFTKLGASGNFGSGFVQGIKVKGQSSGATGITATDSSSSSTMLLHSVVGTFQANETVQVFNGSDTKATNSLRIYDSGEIKRLHQNRGTGDQAVFGADVVLEDNFFLTGSASVTSDTETSSADTITGSASRFLSELVVGDKLLLPNGDTTTVTAISSNTSMSVSDISNTAEVITGNIIRQRAKFQRPDQTVAISGLPNQGIKDISQIETEIIRRQKNIPVASNTVTMSASDGTFVAFSEDDYHVALPDGSKLALNDTGGVGQVTGAGTNSVVINVGSVTGECKVIATLQRATPTINVKTFVQGACITVNSASVSNNYGIGFQDKDISLGVADVYAIRGIYEGGDALNPTGGSSASDFVTTPLPPSFTYTPDAGSNALNSAGTEIVGVVSGARGILIDNDGTSNFFYYVENSPLFQSGEGITFVDETSKSGTIANVTKGSKNITSSFIFDDGQRDGFYGLSKITRKESGAAPQNPIMIVFDYFTHGAGNNFTGVASYPDLSPEEIPVYESDRFDPSASLDEDGVFNLADSIDYRPVAGKLVTDNPDHDVSTAQDISSVITVKPFDYSQTSFDGDGYAPDLAKIGSNITIDYEYYLPRRDRIFLSSQGEFIVVTGEPSENPVKGAKVDNAIEIAEVFIPAFTPDVGEVQTKLIHHRRYTMRDLDGIQRRLTQLETAVSLSMLEEKTETLQVLDDDGFDRFKSGFVVDAFKGHGVGDVFHPDYGVSIDQKNGVCRPAHRTNYFDLSYNSGLSSTITRSGDLLTLPFTEEAHITSTKASKQVNVNPYDVANFVGRLELSPDKDVWHDMEQLPNIISSQEGNFDAILAGVEVGTVWNDWQQTWAGTPIITRQTDEVIETRRFSGIARGDFEAEPEMRRGRRRRFRRRRGRRGVRTTVTRTIPTQDTRTGIITNVVEDIVETRADRVVGVSAINFMRTIDITISGELLKPNTALNVFFDNVQVNAHCTPSSATYGVNGGTAKGTQLKTDNQGKLNAIFTVPNTDALRFETGIRTLKVTDTATVDSELSTTSAFTNFMANGSLTSQQTEFISTRNGRVTQETINEARGGQLVTTNSSTRWVDPLAQSFLIEKEEGVFINSIEVFFSAKDGGGLPVTCSIRQMLNGSPTQKVLPLAEKTLYPNEVNVSVNAQTPTKFTFPAPVYLNPQTEYCFVLESNSNAYLTWVAEMGDFDVHTKEPIDKQPYAGVLFKSQNSSTWTPEQLQDLKFNINRCKFNSSSGKVVLENNAVPVKKLKNNPVQVFGSADRNRVKVFHQAHGMYDTDSKVILANVKGDRSNSIRTFTVGSPAGTAAGAAGTHTATGVASGNGKSATFNLTLSDTNQITSGTVKLNNPGSQYAVNETFQIPNSEVGGTGSDEFVTITVNTVEDSLGGIPISLINATNQIASFDIDSYEFDVSIPSTMLGAVESTRGGGEDVTATENMYYDVLHTLVPNIIHPKTGITSEIFRTTTGQINGDDNSYSRNSAGEVIVLNDNNFLFNSGIVASEINETDNMSGVKSFKLELDMTSTSDFVSPVVDVGSIGANTIMNRIDAGTTATNTGTVASTEPEGDNNAAIYCTRLVQLENPASQLKVVFDGFRPAGIADGQIRTYFKLLKSDSTLPFEELGWTEFATTNVPDADSSKFRSYEYDALDLEEFVGFAIKVVMQSKRTVEPCAIRAFRSIALA